MTVRAVCTDIDGTLLDRNRELSAKTISVFHLISGMVPVILASSRMPAAMTHLQQELGILNHPLIAYNGGYVIRVQHGTAHVYDSVTIPVEVCRSITGLIKGTKIHASLYHGDDWFAPARDQWTDREERITKVQAQIRPAEKVLDDWERHHAGAHKVMCMGDADEIAYLQQKLLSKHALDLNVYLSRPTYLELAPASISKGSALKLILEKQYNIPVSDVIAFGDNYNDIELLRMAGLGVAVNNAREEVKAIADELTLDSIRDGVAVSLIKWMNLSHEN